MDAERKEMILKIEDISKKFGKTTVLRGISMEVKKGEIMGVVGASGCGKSTLLGVIAGMLAPDGGKIMMNGKVISEECNVLAPEKRHMNMVSQNFETCSHKTVYENIVSGLKKSWFGKTEDGELVPEVIKLLHLTGLEKKYPSELSGGQRQRVAIARAVTMKPELFIADEPIASLDVSIQAQIVNLFRHLQRSHGFSILFIAHDLAMVEFLCDRVGVMYHGQLVEVAPCKELYQNPLHPYTKALLAAIPVPDPELERSRSIPVFSDQAFLTDGELKEVLPGHFVLQTG